jgi:hypothetical protein
VPGCGSRSIRSSSGWSTSSARVCHGWNVTVPRLAAQATSAGDVTHRASAERPDGNVIRAVRTHSGAYFGNRFW